MKIDSNPDSYIGSVAGGPQKVDQAPQSNEAANAAQAGQAAQAKGPAPAAAAPQPGVSVSLSDSTTQALSSGGGEVFNSEKVEAMKQAIANGTFEVNAEAIADKMLSNAAEMLGGAKS